MSRGRRRAVLTLAAVWTCWTAAAGSARADDPWVARCAEGKTAVRGIDVSKWQGEIDWGAVARAGVRFAYIRVSDGRDVPDPQFARNWREARRAGVIRGAYQFFRPQQDPAAQADLLLRAVGAPRRGDLPPALDVEVDDGVDPAELIARMERWIERVRQATGVTPVVYTNALGWSLLTENTGRFRGHPLWIAHHGAECPNTPAVWPAWTFHQFSTEGRVAGIAAPVDQNHFPGDLRALRRVTLADARAARRLWARWRREADSVR